MKKLILFFAMILGYQITPALADQGATEERLMFRYRAATEDELNLMRTDRGINLKAAIIVTEILPGFLTTQNDFKPNDIVRMVNGQYAITPEALEKLVAQIEPADKIKLIYIDTLAQSQTNKNHRFELVKGGVQKTLYYTLAVSKSKLEDKPPVSTKPVDTSSPSTSTPTVSEPIKTKLAFADQGTTEERLMFRYRAATEDEVNRMRTDRGINLKAAVIVTKILPGFPSTQREFKPNDIVLMVNGQSAITPEALEKLLAKIEPADKIKLSYIDMEGRIQSAGDYRPELVKEGVKKTLNYTLAVSKSKLEDKPPVSTKPVDTSSPGTSTPIVPEPTVSQPIQTKPVFADQGTTEERLMFRYRAATKAELIQMLTDRGINLKAAVIVTKILPGFLSTQRKFKPNDIVLMVNGQSALTPEALEKLVAQIEPADKIKLSYIDMTARNERSVRYFELVKGGVQKTLYYTLAVIESKVVDKPPVSTKPPVTPRRGSTAKVPEPTVAKVVGIKTEFDPFKSLYSTSFDFSLIKIQHCPKGLTTQLVSVKQKTTVGFPTTTLFIISTNPEWKFLGKPESLTLTVIIDNKNRFEIKCFDKTSYVFKTGTCYENMSFNLDKQQLQSFAAATKIKAQLASSEFEFPNEYPVYVKQFLEEIQKPVKARHRSQ